MADKTKKSAEILRRLRVTKENLGTLNQLLTEALGKLDDVTKRISDEAQYIPADVVQKNWIRREEAGKLLEAQALLEECQNEINDIDAATKDVEKTLDPIMTKIKTK
jgi:predicted transcriptional regulator